MINRGLLFILTMCISVSGLASGQGQPQKQPYEPLELPSGKHFPVSQSHLLRLRDRADKRAKACMRAHAWDLFAGLTKASPVWNTWYTKCDVGLKKCGTQFEQEKPNLHRPLRNFEVPVQLLNQLYATYVSAPPQSSGTALNSDPLRKAVLEFATNFRAHPQFASVIFNQEAADAIRDNCLLPSNAGVAMHSFKPCPPTPVPGGKIKEFKRGAVVLKTFWELLIPGQDGIGELSTWNQEVWNNIQQENDPNIARFQIPTLRVATTSESPCQNRDYANDETVPISCFYAFKLSQQDVDALRASPPDLVALSDSGVVADNFLVLVAVHVTTKEIPDWVWATFWWDNHGVSDSRADGRPGTIGPKWRHFLMENTLSGTTPTEKDGGPKICFNPYLETAIPNGVISNCLQCHSKAAYGPPSRIGAYDLGILGRNGSTLASHRDPDPHYFDNRVQTDFMWSVADAQNPNIKDVLDLLNTDLRDLQLQSIRIKQQDAAPSPKR